MKSRHDCDCPCHSGSVLVHPVPCCDGLLGYFKQTNCAREAAGREDRSNFIYNFARIHKTLRITPAMAAGSSNHVWSLEEIVMMADNYMPKPGKRGPYKRAV